MLENTFLLRLSKQPWCIDYHSRDETVLEIESLLKDKVALRKDQYNQTVLVATVIPDIEDCVKEFPWSRAEAELALYIIAIGESNGSYGIALNSETTQDLAELVLGGVDWNHSRSPYDDVWSIWGGTFAEDDRVNKLSVRLDVKNTDVCSRYYDYDKVFGIDMPSISNILKSASGYFLGQL